jgi:hypothetical protein
MYLWVFPRHMQFWDYVCQTMLIFAVYFPTLCLNIASVTDISFRLLYSQLVVDLSFFFIFTWFSISQSYSQR